jgi:Resolvase, N terminal domain
MRTVAYIRISTGGQGLESQRLAILDYAHRHGLTVQTFVEAQASSRHAGARRSVDMLLEQVHAGDLILVSELSRLGRSVGQIIQLVDRLLKQQVQLVAIKEHLWLNGAQDLQTKVMMHTVRAFRGDRTRSDCRAHQRGLGRGPRPGPAAGAAERGPRDVQAHGLGSGDSTSPGQNGLESVDRENSGGLPLDPAPFYPVQRLGLRAPQRAAVPSCVQRVHVGQVAPDMGSGKRPGHSVPSTIKWVEGTHSDAVSGMGA